MKNIVFLFLCIPLIAISQLKRPRVHNGFGMPKYKKVNQFYEGGNLKYKGREKKVLEWKGCIGYMHVYHRTGRWKYYNQQGELMKIIRFKNDKEIKVIRVINR
ncbi:MAG: hypothetical protein EP305_05180 [Bacteroidetes bacterium]|nr:MAG: hypothetical protein EP305_05180 [Bacteroidota bacterium]